MAIKNCIGIANAVGFGRKVKVIPKELYYILWDDGNKIAFDNNNLIIAK